MNNELLPQDIHLLAMKWADPQHLPLDESIGPSEWRKKYKENLEVTIAEWLSKGMLTYQYPHRRIDAFIPISHIVGTSRDSISYIDSLLTIARVLMDVRDPNFRPHPNVAFPQEEFVSLGECFAGGIGKAPALLSNQFAEDSSQQEEYFYAIIDTLTLIQSIKPYNTGSSLYATWSILNGRAKKKFAKLAVTHPWEMEHAFVLACYPVCNIAVGNEVRAILNYIDPIIQSSKAPSIVKSDYKACKEIISLGKYSAAQKLPSFLSSSGTKAGFKADKEHYPDILPRYQYKTTGELDARY